MSIISHMEVMAETEEVFATLCKNREKHSAIVKEANIGYLKKLTEVLSKKLEEARAGKLPSLTIHLRAPVDYTKIYDTAIMMFELHKRAGQSYIKLTGEQVRNLIQDEWDWTETFYGTNSSYSKRAEDHANVKGG